MAQIDELRRWRNDAIGAHLYSTAELVGAKVLTLSGRPDDAYWLAQTYYGMGEYLRGAELVLKHAFEEVPKCRYVAALCLLQAQELDRALQLLTSVDVSIIDKSSVVDKSAGNDKFDTKSNMPSSRVRVVSTSSLKKGGRTVSGARTISGSSGVSMILPELDEFTEEGEELHGVFVQAMLEYLLGRVYSLQSKFELAKTSYINALRTDARCFEAMAQLVKVHALTPKEEWQLLKSLDFDRVGADFGHSIYALRLSVLTEEGQLDDAVHSLVEVYEVPRDDGDILSAQAEAACTHGQFSEAKRLFDRVLAQDPYNVRVYASYAHCLLELGEKNVLYTIVHELAATAPESVETWYAIGIYYVATHRASEARRYFSKASMLDPGFAPAWLAFAHTFAVEAEHEQAITAFTTASKLFPGYYMPYVHIGIQHLQLLNYNLADKFLRTAESIYEDDPLLMNELGVVAYYRGDLYFAQRVLELAFERSERAKNDVKTRASIMANLGFVHRKAGNPQLALDAFNAVCRFTKLDTNILSAMGLCYLQLGQDALAAEKLALALAINRDDTVANDLMKRAVRETSTNFDVEQFAKKNEKYMNRRRVPFIEF